MKDKAVNLDFLTLDMIKIETRDEIKDEIDLQPKMWMEFWRKKLGEDSGPVDWAWGSGETLGLRVKKRCNRKI